jgi:hypothetical protein
MFGKLFSVFLFATTLFFGTNVLSEKLTLDVSLSSNHEIHTTQGYVFYKPQAKIQLMALENNGSSSSTGSDGDPVIESSTGSEDPIESSTGSEDPIESSTGSEDPIESSTGSEDPIESSTGSDDPTPDPSSTGEVDPDPEPEPKDFVSIDSVKLFHDDARIHVENVLEDIDLTFHHIDILNGNDTEVFKLEFHEYETIWTEPYYYQLNLLNCLASHFQINVNDALIKIQAVVCNHTFTFDHYGKRYLLLEYDLKVNIFVNDAVLPEDYKINLNIGVAHEGNRSLTNNQVLSAMRKIKEYLKDTAHYITFEDDALIDFSQFYLQLPLTELHSETEKYVDVLLKDSWLTLTFKPSETIFYNFIVGTVPKLLDYEKHLEPTLSFALNVKYSLTVVGGLILSTILIL